LLIKPDTLAGCFGQHKKRLFAWRISPETEKNDKNPCHNAFLKNLRLNSIPNHVA
jgi:hypothetical protein